MKNMINLKALLRLIGAGVLTTVAASSVVACGETPVVLNTKVSQNLRLTNDKGQGLIKAQIDTSTVADKVVWKTVLDTEHLAAKLVKSTDAKVEGLDSDSTNFLKNVLKLTTDGDNKFTYSDVSAIIAKVDSISPTIGLNTAKNDYVITGGTYMLQFFKSDGTTKLGDNYSVNLAIDASSGVVDTAIPSLTLPDFVKKGDFANFTVGQPVTNLVGKTIELGTITNSAKQTIEIMKLLGNKTFTFTVTNQSPSVIPANWESTSTITVNIKTDEVTFNKLLTLNPSNT